MFSLNRLPSTIPGYRGVYLMSSRKNLYRYPHGRSSLVYIGSGWIADRLKAHVSRTKDVRRLLRDEGTLWFSYASVPKDWHQCVEQVLFDAFEERHGSLPLFNDLRPHCPRAWDDVVVNHDGLSFPYDFSRTAWP